MFKTSFVRRKFNAMLGVATVSMSVNFIVMLAGSLIAGNFLGKEALAGINVCSPIFAVSGFVGALISVGSGLVFSRAMGAFDAHRAACVWTQSFLLSLGLGALIFFSMQFGGSFYMDFSGVTGVIREEAVAYWRWQTVSMSLTPVVLLVLAMVYADGDSVVALAAGGCYVFGTLVFSTAFTCWTGHSDGISSGTAVTMVLVLAISSLHLLRRNNHLRFVRRFSRSDLAQTILCSLPDSTIYLCWGVLMLVVNRLTVFWFNEGLLAVVALGVSVVQFSIVFDGVGEALIPIGGMYAGERNAPALRELAGYSAAIATAEGILVSVIMLLFAEPIAVAYGFRGEAAAMLPQAIAVLRCLAFAMPFMGFLMMVNTHFLVVGHPILAVSVTVMKDFAFSCIFAVALSHYIGFVGIWIGFVIGYAISSVVPFAYVRLIHGRSRFPWLIAADSSSIDFTVRLSRSSVESICGRIRGFLAKAKSPVGLVTAAVRCSAEYSSASLLRNADGRVFLECFVSVEPQGGIRLIFRDDGECSEIKCPSCPDSRYLNTLNCNRTEFVFSNKQ